MNTTGGDNAVRDLCKAITAYIESTPDKDIVPISRRIDMAASLFRFTADAIEKYYKGQREHGGDICDRDLDSEARQERIDEFWFTEAKWWKEAK